MLTIKLDNDTELALQELAQQQGKTSEQWLKEIISQFVKEKKTPRILPDLAEFRAKFPKQSINAGEFCRTMREEDRY
jgi:predicted transcriptional regulator